MLCPGSYVYILRHYFDTTVYRKPQSATSVLGWKVNHFPEPPSQDYIDYKMKEERQVARQKELKEKTDAILQRRR